MTKKEKLISSLKRRIKKTQDILDRNTEKLNQLKSELDMAEMDNLKAVLNERGMTIEEILKNISSDTANAINEKKMEPENKAEYKNILEEKKNVGF